MSWTVQATGIAPEEIMNIELPEGAGGSPENVAETKETFELARVYAKGLVDSGHLGRPAKVNVSLAGHANPGYKATPGWANDTISISVGVAEYAPEEIPENPLTNDDPAPELAA